jgi:hypothetical protein
VSSRSQSAQLDLRKQFASFGNCYFCTKVFKIRFMIGKFPTKQNFKTGFPQFKFRAMVLEKFCEILSRPNYVTLLFVWCQFPKVLVISSKSLNMQITFLSPRVFRQIRLLNQVARGWSLITGFFYPGQRLVLIMGRLHYYSCAFQKGVLDSVFKLDKDQHVILETVAFFSARSMEGSRNRSCFCIFGHKPFINCWADWAYYKLDTFFFLYLQSL